MIRTRLLYSFILVVLSCLLVFGMPPTQEKTVDMKDKYLKDVIGNDRSCLSKLHYGIDETSPPSDENPIQYLYMFQKCRCIIPENRQVTYACDHFGAEMIRHLRCLERLAAQPSPHFEIVTCQHPRFKRTSDCSWSSDLFEVCWYPKIFDSFVEMHKTVNDDDLANRIVLFNSILQKHHYLTQYLLGKNIDVGKEHLAAALSVGNESLFYQLVQPFKSDQTKMTQLLGFPIKPDSITVTTYNNRWVAKKVQVQGWLPDGVADVPEIAMRSEHIALSKLLDFMFSFVKVRYNHFLRASTKNDMVLLQYLIDKASRQLEGGSSHRSLFQTALDAVVESGNSDGISTVLKQENDWEKIYSDDESKKLLLAFAAKTRGNITMIADSLLKHMHLSIKPDHVITAIHSGATYETAMWFVDRCEWTREGLQAFINSAFVCLENPLEKSKFGASIGFRPGKLMQLHHLQQMKELLRQKLRENEPGN